MYPELLTGDELSRTEITGEQTATHEKFASQPAYSTTEEL